MSAAMDVVDEALYSRQLYVMGREAQQRILASNVLIVGLGGVGVEAAKNIILAGVKSVTLHDDTLTDFVDLSSQFYLSESDVGISRAQVSGPKLAELNPYVPVSVHTGELTNDVIARHSVVLLAGVGWSERSSIAQFCHEKNIAIVISDSAGVFGSVFCDFGERFIVNDTDGETVPTSIISAITKASPALVTCLEETRHHLSTGDTVSLSEVKGMEQLNGQQFVVTVTDPFSFTIPVDSSSFPSHVSGGYVQHIKQPTTVCFKPFAVSYEAPGEFVCDFNKFDCNDPLHVAFRALHTYKERFGSLPVAGSADHAEQFLEVCRGLNAQNEGTDKFHVPDLERHAPYLRRFALCCRGQCNPVCALLGGVVGQEVLKGCSGKFMPIKQWFYYDGSEALSDTPLSAEEVAPMGCRYDGQIMIFGRSLQRRLHSLNMFLVGAGAIGCEMLKNWALMGVSCDASPRMVASSDCSPDRQKSRNSGTVFITDMDHIEKSNLSRQFLFRSTDINKPKSTTAANAAVAMNRSFRIQAYESKVGPDTENVFSDDFFEGLDAVCTALDNVEARLYIDQRCLFYRKPMLESGTLGAKGNTQVVVPHKTEHYGATRDPPEQSIPVCTLKHFPNAISHTLQWAREWFEEQYKQTPDVTNQYLSLPPEAFAQTLASQQNMKLDSLNKIQDSLVTSFPVSIEDCIRWARIQFEEHFSNRILQLLHSYPLDKVVGNGTPFWTGAKRAPHALKFDSADPLHLEFVQSVAHMRATLFNIAYDESIWGAARSGELTALLADISVPAFRPKDGVKIPTTEEEAKEAAKNGAAAGEASSSSSDYMDVDEHCANMLAALPSPVSFNKYATSAAVSNPDAVMYRLNALEFEKDDDAHMRVVAAASNLRARNYSIKEEDLHTSRGIAGKITPAIATTTAFVAGSICLELLKILQDKPITAYRNVFTNLALPLFTSMEPEPPQFHKSMRNGKEWAWSQWDYVDVDHPNMTLKELIAWLEENYGVAMSMLSSGVTMLFSDFMSRQKKEERLKMTIPAVVEAVTKVPITPGQKYVILELLVEDLESGDEVEVPYLRFRLF